nr:Fic family protein [Salicibibacter kimchii]
MDGNGRVSRLLLNVELMKDGNPTPNNHKSRKSIGLLLE